MKKNINLTDLRSELDTYGLPLRIRWSVSRGRDTYGYNICSLLSRDRKLTDCNGGGYDMQGTVIGDLITALFPSELAALSANAELNKNGYSDGREIGLYGLITVNRDGKRRNYCDGGCGLSSMEWIIKALGYRLRYIERNVYLLEKAGE